MVSRFGNDSEAFIDVSAKMLTTFIMTMRGTPYYYNGDELGMTNIRFTNIDDYRDVQTLNAYKHEKNIGGNLDEFMKRKAFESRDNGRTPFQWNDKLHAGFSTGNPWIKVNPNYKTINEEAENKNSNSVLNYFRKVVQLRKQNDLLVYGDYELLDKNNPDVYAYTRNYQGNIMMILLNFTSHDAITTPLINLQGAKLLINNYTGLPKINDIKVLLKPYQAVVYQLAN